MTDATPERKRTWVGRWVRSESFWQDVTSRTLSGVIVGLIGLVAVGALGIIDFKAVGVVGFVVLVVMVLLVALGAWALLIGRLLNPIRPWMQTHYWWSLLIQVLIILFPLGGAMFGAIWLGKILILWAMAW
jgi:hypothetical protein